jgi:putative Mn2+ efflux pump MntP
MPVSVSVLGLLLGLDSLAAGLGIGMSPPGPGRWRLALAFAACDGLASLLGAALSAERLAAYLSWSEWLGPLALGSYGVYVMLLTARRHRSPPGAAERPAGPLTLVLPLCLSLDNLLVGVGPDVIGWQVVPAAAFVGCLSGLLALSGLELGAVIRSRLPARAEWAGGGVLVLTASILVCVELWS